MSGIIGALSGVGAIASLVGVILKIGAAVGLYRAGEKAQSTADQTARADALEHELEATVEAPTTVQETAEKMKKGEF